ncbi:unnamed protein product [Mytilus edulis]|uniref:Uncharacterized protein n=1 Tax=Mytilus edulis TaxID=6550 RepID=A0A8S3TF44_MYTED|nr:unnamed protein product [Mytilus edulis]
MTKYIRPAKNLVASGARASVKFSPWTLTDVVSNYQDFQLRPLRVGALSFGKRFGGSEVFSYIENNSRQFVREEFLTDQDVNQNAISTYSVDFESIFSKGFDAIHDSIVDDSSQNDDVKLFTKFLDSLDYHEGCLLNFFLENTPNISEPEMRTNLATHVLLKSTTKINLSNALVIYVKEKCIMGRQHLEIDISGIADQKLCYSQEQEVNVKYLLKKDDQLLASTIQVNLRVCLIMTRVSSDVIPLYNKLSVRPLHLPSIRDDTKYPKTGIVQDIVTAIPTIVLNPFGFDVYIYDPQHDVLLRNFDQPIPFWRQSESNPKQKVLNKSSLLQLWLMMNHLVFKPQFTKDGIIALGGTAGFLSQVDSVRMERLEEMMNLGLPAKAKDFKLSEFKSTIPAYHISCRDNQEQRNTDIRIRNSEKPMEEYKQQ